MSIKGTTQELFVGKKEINIISRSGTKTTIPYSDVEKIEYCLAENKLNGNMDFLKNGRRNISFKFGTNSNDAILRMVEFVKNNVPTLTISEIEYDIDEIYPEKRKGSLIVKIVSILLIIVGVIGVAMAMIMYGDIGIACMVGSISSFLSGIGFFMMEKKL